MRCRGHPAAAPGFGSGSVRDVRVRRENPSSVVASTAPRGGRHPSAVRTPGSYSACVSAAMNTGPVDALPPA